MKVLSSPNITQHNTTIERRRVWERWKSHKPRFPYKEEEEEEDAGILTRENKASAVIVNGVADGRVWKELGGRHRTSQLVSPRNKY